MTKNNIYYNIHKVVDIRSYNIEENENVQFSL